MKKVYNLRARGRSLFSFSIMLKFIHPAFGRLPINGSQLLFRRCWGVWVGAGSKGCVSCDQTIVSNNMISHGNSS